MKKNNILEIKLYVILLLYFSILMQLGRALYSIYSDSTVSQDCFFTYKILYLDAVATAYILSSLLVVSILSPRQYLSFLIKFFISTYSILIVIINYSSAQLYLEWGEILSKKSLAYLKYSEGILTALRNIDFSAVAFVFITFLISIVFSRYLITPILMDRTRSNRLITLLLLIPLLILCRGGLQKIPINSSTVYENDSSDKNLVRVNKAYYLMESIFKKAPFHLSKSFTYQQAFIRCKDYVRSNWFDAEKPNIVTIILEGVPRDIFEPAYQLNNANYMPFLDSMRKSGIDFTKLYASGFRTDQGILSILSGIPALPSTNIMKDVVSVDSKPSISKTLKKNGYTNHFYYGGDLAFSEMNIYLPHQGFDRIYDKADFKEDKATNNYDWGYSDELLIRKFLNTINSNKQPFFVSLLTLSTHPPFDMINKEGSFQYTEKEKFISSLITLDHWIEEAFRAIIETDWYNNSVFVVVSDHSSTYLKNRHYNDHDRWKIPFFIFGPKLSIDNRNTSIKTICNQHDIPKTLEVALKLKQDEEDYEFSRNINCSEFKESAYWASSHTAGYITDSSSVCILLDNNSVVLKDQSSQDSLTLKNTIYTIIDSVYSSLVEI